jgi:hypothetical protein
MTLTITNTTLTGIVSTSPEHTTNAAGDPVVAFRLAVPHSANEATFDWYAVTLTADIADIDEIGDPVVLAGERVSVSGQLSGEFDDDLTAFELSHV